MAQYDAMAELMRTLVDEEASPKLVDEMTAPRRVVAPKPTAPAPPPSGAQQAGTPQMSGGGLPTPPPMGSPPPSGMPVPQGAAPQGTPQPPQGMPQPPQGNYANRTPQALQGAPQVSMGGKFQSLRAQQLQEEAMTGGSGRSTSVIYKRRMAKKAREEEMKFRQMSAQQQQEANIEAARIAAQDTYKLALELTGDEEASLAMADSVLERPDTYAKTKEGLMTTYEAKRKEKAGWDREDDQEEFHSRELAQFYLNETDMGTTEEGRLFASGLARNNVPPQTGLPLWYERQEAIASGNEEEVKAVNRAVDSNSTKQLITQQVSAIRDNINTGILPETGFGGALVRKATRMLDDPKGEGEVGLFESFSDAGEVARRNEVIKNNIGLAAINNMRQFSPSGGALGNVSNFEVRMVQNVKDALDPTRNKEEYLTALDTVEVLQERAAYLQRHGRDMIEQAKQKGIRPEVFVMDNLNKQFPIDEQFSQGILDAETGWDGIEVNLEEDQGTGTGEWGIKKVK